MKTRSLLKRMVSIYGLKSCKALALRLNERRESLTANQHAFVSEMHIYLLGQLSKKQFDEVHNRAVAVAIAKAS